MSPERKLERKLVQYCKDYGIYCRKFVSPGHAGVPDRVLVGPKATVFLELKSPGQQPTRLQMHEMDGILMAGGQAFWADSWEKAKEVADKCLHGLGPPMKIIGVTTPAEQYDRLIRGIQASKKIAHPGFIR